jgi:hypothetical protein
MLSARSPGCEAREPWAGVSTSKARVASLFHAIEDVIVILVARDPEPPEMVFSPERNSSVGSPDINRPDISFGLKSKGRMIGISFEKLVLLDGQVSYRIGELCEKSPKA